MNNCATSEPQENEKKIPRPIDDTRYRNFQEIRKRSLEDDLNNGLPARGDLTRLAKKLEDTNPKYLSHVNTRHKAIGDNLARTIERVFKLPEGWMDKDHVGGALIMDDHAREFFALATELYLADREGVKLALMQYMKTKLNQAQGKPH